jgi:hypothetical protein
MAAKSFFASGKPNRATVERGKTKVIAEEGLPAGNYLLFARVDVVGSDLDPETPAGVDQIICVAKLIVEERRLLRSGASTGGGTSGTTRWTVLYQDSTVKAGIHRQRFSLMLGAKTKGATRLRLTLENNSAAQRVMATEPKICAIGVDSITVS